MAKRTGDKKEHNDEGTTVKDEESGLTLKFGTGEMSTDDDGGGVHLLTDVVTVDMGDLTPAGTKGQAHAGEVLVNHTINSEGGKIGGHFDVVGVDVQAGDDQNHIKAGFSVGEGAGVEWTTGADSDHDGKAEYGIGGEFGAFSGDVKVEPQQMMEDADELAVRLETGRAAAIDAFADDPLGVSVDLAVSAATAPLEFQKEVLIDAPVRATQAWGRVAEKAGEMAADRVYEELNPTVEAVEEVVRDGFDAAGDEVQYQADRIGEKIDRAEHRVEEHIERVEQQADRAAGLAETAVDRLQDAAVEEVQRQATRIANNAERLEQTVEDRVEDVVERADQAGTIVEDAVDNALDAADEFLSNSTGNEVGSYPTEVDAGQPAPQPQVEAMTVEEATNYDGIATVVEEEDSGFSLFSDE